MAHPKGFNSPSDLPVDISGTGPSSGPQTGGNPSYPMQTPSNALGSKIVERHITSGDAPSDPRKGSRGNVDRSVTSDAVVKTQ